MSRRRNTQPRHKAPSTGEAVGRGGASGRRDGAARRKRGVYMISVAAELAGMHPQTLRIYEARGLIRPQRSPKGTRLYSDEDVERLRRIQQLTTELGMNLAGVEKVFELEAEIERLQARLRALERKAAAVEAELRAELERVRRATSVAIVPYRQPVLDIVPVRENPVTVRVDRTYTLDIYNEET